MTGVASNASRFRRHILVPSIDRIVFGFTISRGKIVEIHLVSDPEGLRELDLTILDD